MSAHFRRSRPYDVVAAAAAGGPSLSALVATMLLFDRDPDAMVDQVRVWLSEEDRA